MNIKHIVWGLCMTFMALTLQAAAPVESDNLDNSEHVVVVDSELAEDLSKAEKECTLTYDLEFCFDDGTSLQISGSITASDCRAAAKAIAELANAM